LVDAMVELITITESFYACGVASSVYCTKDLAGSVMRDAVFSNIGKLLLATKIYDMHRIAHYVSGGLIVRPCPARTKTTIRRPRRRWPP
jgi:4-hydroxybutyryl-CoA dehydratase/vinylacetyl-CoA-Delta-isomerase